MAEQQIHIDPYERTWITIITVMLGVFFATLIAGMAIFGVANTEEGGFINPSAIDNTVFASPGIRHMGGNQYEAVILAYMWAFEPAELRVPAGSEVTFVVTSRDISHGFMIEHHNANMELLPGHISRIQARFNEPGEYRIICNQYCGRGHQIMHAVIVVEEAETSTVALTEE